MDDLRMRGLTFDVKKTAAAISAALGYNPAAVPRAERRKG
jgi:hypothetical protein